MTEFRLRQLLTGASVVDEAERLEFERMLAWRRRSDAAKAAVRTKRALYTTWPARDRKHRKRLP